MHRHPPNSLVNAVGASSQWATSGCNNVEVRHQLQIIILVFIREQLGCKALNQPKLCQEILVASPSLIWRQS